MRRLWLVVLFLSITSVSQAQTLTPSQRVTVKADVLAQSDLNAIASASPNSDGAFAIAALYNASPAVAYWVWRTNVSRQDIYTKQNDLVVSGAQTGFWNWTTFKNQGATEQTAWAQMFMGDQANFSAQNVRDGVAAIFTGSAAANAQRDHCLAIGRRLATRIEKLLATGTGSTASPGVMGFEGTLSVSDVLQAMGW